MVITDELVEAWAELTRLEEKEQRLLKLLIDVRVATNAQRTRINALVRERGRTISRLPTELLVYIIGFCIGPNSIHWDVRMRRQELACVSRHWRDVILQSPILWKYIVVSPDNSPFLKTQLKRSCGAPLDIRITDWSRSYGIGGLTASLATVTSSADRWRSLAIDRNSEASTELVLNAINQLELPSLRGVNLEGFGLADSENIASQDFLSVTRSPALEHLVIIDAAPTFPTLSQLKTLDLTFRGDNVTLVPSPALFFIQSLTMLSLSGNFDHWSLEWDSVQFPILQTLKLDIAEPRQFMEAIIAPKLESFDYSSKKQDSVVFGRLRNKFSSVRRLSLLHQHHAYDIALSQAFPSVHCVEIRADNVHPLFAHPQKPGPQGYPLGDFHSLELLTIFCPRYTHFGLLDDFEPLVQWLTERVESGQGWLRVKLVEIFRGEKNFTVVYNQLRKCCILELDDVSIAPLHLSKSAHSPLRLVSA
ncbi:hypothetical protein J3A83DRAFT_1128675 [Scleroderma citrinum]